LFPFINQLNEEEINSVFFQHDGATAHTAQFQWNYLKKSSENVQFQEEFGFLVKPTSRHLTSFLWGAAK
jgi:hypothetical protein